MDDGCEVESCIFSVRRCRGTVGYLADRNGKKMIRGIVLLDVLHEAYLQSRNVLRSVAVGCFPRNMIVAGDAW